MLFSVPLHPDLEELMLKQFAKPSEVHRLSGGMCALSREDWLWTPSSHGPIPTGLGVPLKVSVGEATLPEQERLDDGCHAHYDAWSYDNQRAAD